MCLENRPRRSEKVYYHGDNGSLGCVDWIHGWSEAGIFLLPWWLETIMLGTEIQIGNSGLYDFTREGINRGIRYCELALSLDTDYALARAGLAKSYLALATLGLESAREVIPKAKEEARKALNLDADLAEAHSVLGGILHFFEWDWEGAEDHFRRAISLSPNNPLIRTMYAEHLSHLSRFDDAIAEAERAVQLDPISVESNRMLAMALYFARRHDDSIKQCNKTINLDSTFVLIYWFLGMNHIAKGDFDDAIVAIERGYDLDEDNPISQPLVADIYAMVGRNQEARDMLEELKERRKQEEFSPYLIGGVHFFLGETDDAFEWLNKAYEEKDVLLSMMDVHPLMDTIRDDPRFQDLLRRMNFPER